MWAFFYIPLSIIPLSDIYTQNDTIGFSPFCVTFCFFYVSVKYIYTFA